MTRPSFAAPPNARVEQFLPHGPILARAACVVSHGGHGITSEGARRRRPRLRRAVLPRPVRRRPTGRDDRRRRPPAPPAAEREASPERSQPDSYQAGRCPTNGAGFCGGWWCSGRGRRRRGAIRKRSDRAATRSLAEHPGSNSVHLGDSKPVKHSVASRRRGDSPGSANEREGRCRSIYRGSATRRRPGRG